MLCCRVVLVGLVHTLPLMLVVVVGEPFYQLRDHRDQSKYLRKHGNENVVKDQTDAEFVLSKYGYLRCNVSRKKRETSDNMDTSEAFNFQMVEEGGETCDETAVQKAIRNYQRTYNLPETGVLDEDTKSLMSTSRCGNKDSDKEQVGATIADEDESALDILIDKGDAASASSHHRNQIVRDEDDENKSSEVKGHRLWKRSLHRRSRLFRILTGDKPRTRTQDDHRRYVEEYARDLKKTAKGKRRLLHRYTPKERSKRSVHVWTNGELPLGKYRGDNGEMFNKETVTWRLLTTGFSTRIPEDDQRGTISLAFRMWSEVIPLKFIEDRESDINHVDIEIAFGKGFHQNCEHKFDGNGGEIAHSWSVGNMHFDDEENFRSTASKSPDGIYLLRVAVHEIGHVLGLAHTNKSKSIMYAIYRGAQMNPEFELSRDDRQEIQKIYGVCKGSFSTIFDWLRLDPSKGYIYNTYFFRGDHYWMYENRANRTRYGDPHFIASQWMGVPEDVDGYVHIWPFNREDGPYFFKGEHYYKYDSLNDRVEEGWPRNITEDFGPKKGQTEAIPTHLDSVFYDRRDLNIYFFKDEYVYVYNPHAPEEEKGCCERKRKITEEFPAAEGHEPLPSNLDSVYFSYTDNMMYFIKGENLWRNKLYHHKQRHLHNSIVYMGPWYNKWVDICDVVVKNRKKIGMRKT